MKKTLGALSFGYVILSVSAGLLVHPYKTVRELVRGRGLLLLIWLPLWWWLVFLGLSAILYWVLVGVGEWGGFYWGESMRLLAQVAFWWMWWFLWLWQLPILYLALRFWRVMRRT